MQRAMRKIRLIWEMYALGRRIVRLTAFLDTDIDTGTRETLTDQLRAMSEYHNVLVHRLADGIY